ncbi:stage II sporulation protein P [Clostridioides difficile]|uniref:stage II sporulation protein P n=1 Tax=Clostridioides difficile TaxID=1496 RepID=UPI00097FD952|nr:stage II sporulation protein P [Clostridioides difficile]MBY2231665.1 stage II sporulation protein P [Clostridioides difficile]MCV2269674.1 stage II sporulation protein P [Clostridioides difficile]MDV9711066.1 stage II sporulation protein P [Clostridioides difficile]SJP13742.1 stage II sporulation protein P [Clostridioides difficile]HBF4254112.1 stage II sporulation protein P [Clostridioides difficile]
MFKKCIKVVTLTFILACILPGKSLALNQDDFLKFLVNSSYPEAKVEGNDTENKNNNKNKETSKENKEESKEGNTKSKDASKVDNKKESEKEYIKLYVGKENIPDIESKNSDTTETNTTSSSDYKDDLRVTKENPRILIYHTHGCETYSNSPDGNYHSRDKKNSVMEVGSALTSALDSKGWGVVHTTKYHDYPSYNNSYASSLKTIQSILPKYNSVDIAIDLHRDARDLTNPATKEKDHLKYTTMINGERVSKFFFVVGGKNTNRKQLRALAEDITAFAEKKYPGLVSPIVEKDYARFNQFAVKNHMLVEIGNNATSVEESKATTKYLAEILDEYFKQKN